MTELVKREYRFLEKATYDQTEALDEPNQLGEKGWEVTAAWGTVKKLDISCLNVQE
ncbi:MAG: hypothetical protein ABR907_15315 [Terracidiphilus sp.]